MHLIRINIFLMILMLCSCASAPTNVNDGCSLLSENERWYDLASETKSKWGVSIGTQLAFIRQESGFNEDAQPPPTTIFWFIPWKRLSSAYGYAQVLNGTWDWYKKTLETPMQIVMNLQTPAILSVDTSQPMQTS